MLNDVPNITNRLLLILCRHEGPEEPELDDQKKEVESRDTPETCNGSASRKTCKHQSRRERLQREKEVLKQQQQEEAAAQDAGQEGQDAKTGNAAGTPAGQIRKTRV